MDANVTLNWPGGEHVFALRIGELRALQQKCDAGPEQVLMRLRDFSYRVDDVVQPLRLGLIGGGMDDGTAHKTVVSAIDASPFAAFRIPAYAVLMAALYGVEDDQPGKGEGEAGDPPESPEDGSSAPSTGTAPS